MLSRRYENDKIETARLILMEDPTMPCISFCKEFVKVHNSTMIEGVRYFDLFIPGFRNNHQRTYDIETGDVAR